MPRSLVVLGVALIAAAMSGRAHAGAWLAPENGQQIVNTIAGTRAEEPVYEASVYWETPIDDEHTFVAAPWMERADDLEEGWRAEAVVGLKRALFRQGPNVVAVQGSALWRSDAPAACRNGGAELRGLVGRSLGDDAFINLEVAGRALIGGCEGARIDLTAGWRPNDNWLAMGQLFYDAPRLGGESLKLQFSLVRFDRTGRAVQLGVRTRLDGEDTETALVIGLWGRPGD